MAILDTIALESNKLFIINFNGGDLSSDGGLLLIRKFAAKIGLIRLIKKYFKTNNYTNCLIHKDLANLMQVIYQIISAYFQDDCADELTNDPVMTAILEKDKLASQPTLSRFWNRMDNDTLTQFNQINTAMKNSYILSISQEGEGFDDHYQAHGFHPLFCYDGLTGDLLKAELREGAKYCSKDADQFMIPFLQGYRTKYPSLPLYLRGDSGFASPDIYEACEENDCKYAVHLKLNPTLIKNAVDADESLYHATIENQIDYAVEYGEFMYRAGNWSHPKRVVFKIEKPDGQMIHMFTFVGTTMEDMEPFQVLQFYCGRGKMEKFIKEGKYGFDFASASSYSMVVNANRLQAHALAYNLFNWFRRLSLPANMKKQHTDNIRLKLLKVAAKVVHSARYTVFKLCSICPYKKEFYETLTTRTAASTGINSNQ